ncbi:DUF3987 domain-containing protein [Marinobacter shengliensis]|uniref:DUF3987 domain-containing protein n=1 Tax=Marinobacter shengliensis TaxID=1389223 RepID=A0ABV4W3K8_9GAMM
MPSENTIGQPQGEKLDNLPDSSIPHPPGFVGALSQAIERMSIRPVREVSISAALALMAGISGKAWATAGRPTGLNLYIILIARSAIGKEAMHDGINYFYQAAVNDPYILSAAADFFCFEENASAPALMKMLAGDNGIPRQSVVNVLGEFGHIWSALISPKATQNDIKLRGAINRLYSASGPTSRAGGVRYSNRDKDTGTVGSVAYSMIGETTPAKFNNDLTDEIMADGLMSRFTVIEYQGDRPDENLRPVDPDPSVVNQLKGIIAHAQQQQQSNPHQQVQYSEEGLQLLEGFKWLCDNKIRAAGDDEARRQAWNRAHLNALKIACLLAVGDNHLDPVIRLSHADWAVRLMTMNVRIFEEKLDSGDVGKGDDNARTKKVYELLKRAVKGDFDHKIAPAIVELRKAEHKYFIPRRLLQSKTANMKPFKEHPLGATAALDKTLDALIKCGAIERHSGSGGDKTPWSNNSLPKGEYYLVLDLELERTFYHAPTPRSF